MAFKLDVSPAFEYPVKFSTVDSKGRPQKYSFTGIFKRLPRDEAADILNKRDSDDDAELSGHDHINRECELIEQFMTGWSGVDINGPAEYNRENLYKLLNNVGPISTAIFKAYGEAMGGGAAAKN